MFLKKQKDGVCLSKMQTGHSAAPLTIGISLPPDWLFLPAHILQGDSAASYKHSCYTEMQQSAAGNCCTSLHNTCSLSRQLKNNWRWWAVWFMCFLTSRRCSSQVLSCVPFVSDCERGSEWEPEPKGDLTQPLSQRRCRSAGRTLLRSPSQMTYSKIAKNIHS